MIIWRLRPLMAERKITNQELADFVGVSNTTISRWRNTPGDTSPTIKKEILEKLCTKLHCRPEDLLEYTEEREREEKT